jgi:hypothetical protein
VGYLGRQFPEISGWRLRVEIRGRLLFLRVLEKRQAENQLLQFERAWQSPLRNAGSVVG